MMALKRDQPESDGAINRRTFLDILLGSSIITLIGAALYPLVHFVLPPRQPEAAVSTVVAAKVGELKPNSGKIFPMGKDPGILIRTPAGEYRAFTAICTHLACTVQYRKDLKQIWCACHNGHYDLHGKNISGPPPAPLTPFKVVIRGEQIIVSRA
jgi:Rieske Fe-S protein